MIPFSYIDGQLLARLDANGSDAYDINLDRIKAVNGAQKLILSAISSFMASKKPSAEAVRDLSFTAVFQTSMFGQIDIDSLLLGIILPIPSWKPPGHKLWSVLAVYPEFEATGATTIIPDSIPTRSKIRQDIRFAIPIKSAKHWTDEQWAGVKNDPFAPGNSQFTGSLKEYGYVFGSAPLTTSGTKALPLTIVPYVTGVRSLVAVSYLKLPVMVPDMTGETDPLYTQVQLEWPESISELVVAVALRVISYKQGDNSTLGSLSTQEMSILLNAIS